MEQLLASALQAFVKLQEQQNQMQMMMFETTLKIQLASLGERAPKIDMKPPVQRSDEDLLALLKDPDYQKDYPTKS